MMLNLDAVDFAKGNGLVTIVTLDDVTGRVLMVAHADREALECTMQTGEMHYRSRSRGLWRKGATSGNVQRVVSLTPDCDGDAIIACVRTAGPACHTGAPSCFIGSDGGVLDRLAKTIASRDREGANDSSYTRRLLRDRNLRLKKLGEESAELVTALADGNGAAAATEAADLLYHILVALQPMGVTLEDLQRELAARERRGG